jgi:hypothetical protein
MLRLDPMHTILRLFILGSAILVIQVAARAGVVIVAEERIASDEEGKIRKSTVMISGSALRMDGVRGRDLGSLIYLAEPREFILIDKKTESYRRLPRAKIDAALSKAQEAIGKLREKAGELDPEKNEKVTALLDAGLSALQKAADSDSPAITYVKVEENVAVASHKTTGFEGKKGEEKVAEIFTVPVDSLGVTADELLLLNDVRGFFDGAVGKLTGIKSNGALFPAQGTGAEGDYTGIPVKRIRYDDGKPEAEWLLKEVRKEEVPPAAFEIPSGYKEKELALPK